MKLYYLNPNGYGEQFFVMAESKEKAMESILKYIKGMSRMEGDYWDNEHENFSKLHKEGKLANGYSLNEFSEGQVIRSEIA